MEARPAVANPLERVRRDDQRGGRRLLRRSQRPHRHRRAWIVPVNFHGPDGLGYGAEKLHSTATYTNLAAGKTMTEVLSGPTKDLKVSDNGDGTLTLLVLSTGSFKVFGPGGEFPFNDPGQIRFELLIDHAGTPTDPSDDEFLLFLEDLGIVEGAAPDGTIRRTFTSARSSTKSRADGTCMVVIDPWSITPARQTRARPFHPAVDTTPWPRPRRVPGTEGLDRRLDRRTDGGDAVHRFGARRVVCAVPPRRRRRPWHTPGIAETLRP
jgi:hypothetical protein